MIKNYLTIALRTLKKYKGYAAINIFGLAIGLASAILIMLYVQDELSYDQHHENLEQIYRITSHGRFQSDDMNYAVTGNPVGPAMKMEFPGVKEYVRLQSLDRSEFRIGDQKFIEKEVLFADSSIFDVFTIPLIKGNKETALASPDKVVLTETTAERYFGYEDPIGKTITWSNRDKKLEVSGVVKDCPETSHFQYDMLVSYISSRQSNHSLWLSHAVHTYLFLQDGLSPEKLKSQFPDLLKKYIGPEVERFFGSSLEEFRKSGNSWGYKLQPLEDIYLHSDLDMEIGETGNMKDVYFFSIIAIFLIFIAVINFMNLSTAKSANRAKEVGVRKVTGSLRKQLISQFLMEAFVITIIALLVATVFVELSLPLFNNFTNKNLAIQYFQEPGFFLFLLGLGVFVGLLAGSYPAFYLSAYKPITVLKGKLGTGAKNSRLRSILVTFQFIITIVLFISTFIVNRQMQYIKNKDLGFQKDHVMLINQVNALGDNKDAFMQELLKNPQVETASYSRGVPGEIKESTAFYPEGVSSKESMMVNITATDSYFDETYNIEMDEGQFFSDKYSSDSMGVVINEAAQKKLGYESPLGKRLYLVQGDGEDIELRVLGVMKNFNYESLHHIIEPLVLYFLDGRFSRMSVKISPENVDETIDFIKSRWGEFVQANPFNYSFLEKDWDAKYQKEQRVGVVFKSFSIIAILIACLGLLGLASFMAEQRMKEIGVRKVFGASVASIIRLLSREIVVLIIISTLVSWPIAYYFMNNWLNDFAFRVDLNLLVFIVSSLIAFLVAFFIVGYRAYKTATTNPAYSLRDE